MDFFDDLFDLKSALRTETIFRLCRRCSKPLKLDVDAVDLILHPDNYQSPIGRCCK